MRIGLKRRNKPVCTQCDDAGTDPGQPAVLTHALPDKPGAADLQQCGEHEQRDRFQHHHDSQRAATVRKMRQNRVSAANTHAPRLARGPSPKRG
jgi:hypothetical protein